MSEILISGSHGFIGSRITARSTRNRDFIGVVNRELEFPDNDYDLFFHLASYGNMYNQTNLDKIFDVNIENTRALLNLVSAKFFIYFSSSSVYGPTVANMHEGAELTGSTPYAIAKRVGEYECRRFGEIRKTLIIRPFSVTGKGEQSQHLIPTAIRCALTGEVMPFNPYPVHDFIDVDDLLDAIEIIVAKSKPRGPWSEIYNVGTGIQTSNQEVIDIIERLLNKKVKVEIVKSMRKYDSNHWQANITKLKALGWTPQKTLEQSIKEQIDNYFEKTGV